MTVKRRKLLVPIAVAGVLITAATAWKLLTPSAGNKLSYVQSGLSKGEINRPGRLLGNERQHTRTDTTPKKTTAGESSIVDKPLEPLSTGPTPLNLPRSSPGFTSEEEDDYFEMMNAALAQDFPELDLTEMERIELFEAIRQIRRSFEETRSLARSPENAQAFQQLMLQREEAIEQFERIVGMGFNEFMLRTPVRDGGFDRD